MRLKNHTPSRTNHFSYYQHPRGEIWVGDALQWLRTIDTGDIKVIAVFIHDVQRATFGKSIFGINSTFKSNHFLGYTVALNKLNGVYYVDPRPEMFSNQKLREQIRNFQEFLLTDIWERIKIS